MAPSQKEAEYLIELLSRSWDGRATDQDTAEIEAFIQKHGSDGASLLLKMCSVHLELGRHVASSAVFERVIANISEKALQTKRERPAATATWASRFSRVGLQRWLPWAIATSLLVVVGYQYFDSFVRSQSALRIDPSTPSVMQLLRPSRAVGNLAGVQHAVWADGSNVAVGETLNENQRLELLAGSAHLSMACGADIVIEAPCTVTLIADDHAKLEMGKLTAQAAEWATGFAVEANDLQIIDLGTRFALSANSLGIVEAYVLEGQVLAEPMKARRSRQRPIVLKSGQGIRVDGGRSRVDLIDAELAEFADEIERFRPLRPIDIWNTGVGSKVGSDDPHWRVTRGSAKCGPYPRPATITAGDTRSYKDNKPEISQWISVVAEAYPGVPPESVHTFETTFDLTGYDLESVYVVGYFLVDDAINELRINGRPVKFNRWVTTWDVFDFKSFHPIEIVDGFVPGKNVISIDVYNSPSRPETPNDPNPTALRVEWQAFGCEAR
jgi:hypothetical protein